MEIFQAFIGELQNFNDEFLKNAFDLMPALAQTPIKVFCSVALILLLLRILINQIGD